MINGTSSFLGPRDQRAKHPQPIIRVVVERLLQDMEDCKSVSFPTRVPCHPLLSILTEVPGTPLIVQRNQELIRTMMTEFGDLSTLMDSQCIEEYTRIKKQLEASAGPDQLARIKKQLEANVPLDPADVDKLRHTQAMAEKLQALEPTIKQCADTIKYLFEQFRTISKENASFIAQHASPTSEVTVDQIKWMQDQTAEYKCSPIETEEEHTRRMHKSLTLFEEHTYPPSKYKEIKTAIEKLHNQLVAIV